jgi:plastocyanin
VTIISVVLALGAIAMGIAFAHSGPKAGAETAKANKGGAEGTGENGSSGKAVNPGAPAPNGGVPGGGKRVPTGGASQTLTLSADPSGALKFDKAALQGKAGNVKLVMQNPAPVPHNISLEGPGGLKKFGPTVPKGGTSQVAAALKPGTYTYFCNVPGHRQAGMQGTLTVK